VPEPIATYDEALRILTDLAREGDVRAAIALARHLKDNHDEKPASSALDALAARRHARAS
jgi:hypothetical protein